MILHLDKALGGFDGLLNGDDQITAAVIDAALAAPTSLKTIAKYGIGLDTIAACAEAGTNVFVAGTAIFGAPDRAARVTALRSTAEKAGSSA